MEDQWILQAPIQFILKIMEYLDHSELDVFEKPVVLIFTTGDDEYSVEGFNTLDEAKHHMENEHDAAEGYWLDSAYFEGKELEWKERKYFDFVEKKDAVQQQG